MGRGKKNIWRAPLCAILMALAAGCAMTNGRRGLPPPGSPEARATHHCPDRIDRARAGGAVGNVVGFIAASALGSPLLGILYNVGGYAAGFASADRCKKETPTLATVNSQPANSGGVVLAGKIAEEDLK